MSPCLAPNPEYTKRCYKCNEEKSYVFFRKNKSCLDGTTGQCVKCCNAYTRAYQKTEVGKMALRKSGIKYKYGLEKVQYDALLSSQGGVCAICKEYPIVRHTNGTIRFLDVDHNHVTGEVRGILCSYCNRGLGYLRTADVLLSAAIYLQDRGEYKKS